MSEEDASITASGGAAGSKPTASTYYAWNSATSQRAADLKSLGVDTSPKPVAAAAAVPAASPSATGSSAWNSAGTWEERNVTGRAHTALKAAFEGFSTPFEGEGMALTCGEGATVTGQVHLVCVRGKIRPGYELQVTAPFTITGPEGAVLSSGSIAFSDVSDTDSDVWGGLRVTVDSATPH